MPLESVGPLRDLDRVNPDAALYVLAVGVGTFQQATLAELRFAEKDARNIASALEEIGRRCWRSVSAELLVGPNATRTNILRAIQTLSRSIQPQDTAVLFFAGHGLCDERSDVYYFAPFDLIDDNPLATAVPGALLCQHLLPLPGRRLIIVDTCNAGNITDWCSPTRGAGLVGNSTTVLRQFSKAQTAQRAASTESTAEALVVMASTRAGHEALEGARWDNGVFTKALLEGLGGKADNGAGSITLRMLSGYLRTRVRELTHNGQEPVCTVLAGAADFEVIAGTASPKVGPNDPEPMLGKTFSGFKVVARIAQTARCTIYQGLDEENEQDFIQIRVLTSQYSEQPAFVQQFREAAEALQRVSHPALVRILEPGGLSSDGSAFIVFKGAPGRLLGEVIHGALDQSKLPQVLMGILDGLLAIHQAGVLYLSLSPNRIVLRHPSLAVLLQDGDNACLRSHPRPLLVRDETATITDLTDPELYFAPELFAENLTPDERADVFALGALAYLLYAGTPPYSGSTYGALRAAKRQPCRKLQALVPQLPLAIAELLNSMLAPSAAQRPSLAEVRRLWLQYMSTASAGPPNQASNLAGDPRPAPKRSPSPPAPTKKFPAVPLAPSEAAQPAAPFSFASSPDAYAGTIWVPNSGLPPANSARPPNVNFNQQTLIAPDNQVPQPSPLSYQANCNLPTQLLFRPQVPPPAQRPYWVAWAVAAAIFGTGLVSLLTARWLWPLAPVVAPTSQRGVEPPESRLPRHDVFPAHPT